MANRPISELTGVSNALDLLTKAGGDSLYVAKGFIASDLQNGQLTLAKLVSLPTGTLIGNISGSTAAPAALTIAQVLAVLDTATTSAKGLMSAADKTKLDGLGGVVGPQTITLTGDVTGSGTGSFAATIGANRVTNTQLAQVASGTFKARTSASTGNIEDLSGPQATALLSSMIGSNGSTGGAKGLVPAPTASDNIKFLRGDGTWQTVSIGANGNTASRPTLSTGDTGFQYFDTTLDKPIWWDGTRWVDSAGNDLTPSVLSIAAPAAGNEGNSGTTTFTFPVTRTGGLSFTSSASYAVTGSGTNQANATDFVGGVLPSGTVSFAAGESLKNITISVQADSTVETDEGFTVTLSSPAGATLGTASASATILNDDSASLTAPTLTQTSSSGAAPLTWDTATTDAYEGLTIRVEVSATGTKDGSGNYTAPTQSIYKIITNSDIASQSFVLTTAAGANADFVTPSGAYYLHARIESDNGTTVTTSAWSNEISGTISAATTVLSTTTGTEKNYNLTISGTPALSMETASYQGAPMCVRATQAANAANSIYFECKLIRNAGGGAPGFGMDAGTRDLNTYGRPGQQDSTGFFIDFYNGGVISLNRSNSSVNIYGTVAAALNDYVGVKINRTTFVTTIYLIRGTTVLDTVTMTMPSAAWFVKAFGYAVNDDKLTFNFGQSAFQRALDSGVVAYG